jgi:hypothetical protein
MIRIALKAKPAKPHNDYPLFAHASGQWAKKIKGKFHYFGTWDDPDAALNEYLKLKDDLLAGRQPIDEGLTVKELCNLFIDAKEQKVGSGELTPRSLHDYQQTCALIIKTFGAGRRVVGLRPIDFEHLRAKIAKKSGPVTLSNVITRVRMVFNYGYKQDLLDRPVKFGEEFKKTDRKTLRKHKASALSRLSSGVPCSRLREHVGGIWHCHASVAMAPTPISACDKALDKKQKMGNACSKRRSCGKLSPLPVPSL